MKTLSFILLNILLLSCSTKNVKTSTFRDDFINIPIGSTKELVQEKFGRPNIFKSHAENKKVFYSMVGYRREGYLCSIYFDENQKTFVNGFCKTNNPLEERSLDDSEDGLIYRDVWIPINNNVGRELECFSFTDMFGITYKACE